MAQDLELSDFVEAELVDDVAQMVLVTRGRYSDYRVLAVFAGRNDAERWADAYNAKVPWRIEDDRAVVDEEVLCNPRLDQI